VPAGGRKKGNIEIYDSRRFLTVTGCHRAGMPHAIEARQQALEALHRRVFEESKNERSTAKREAGCRLKLEDNEILQKAFNARNGHKAKALYGGDMAATHPSLKRTWRSALFSLSTQKIRRRSTGYFAPRRFTAKNGIFSTTVMAGAMAERR
jgi:hypothetical protein